VLLLALVASACGLGESDPRPITLVVAPHPDDELQGWGALPDDRRAGDVLLVFLTKGERTSFCDPSVPGLAAALGERAPEPTPGGQGSDTCKQARVRSTVRFLARMHETDPSFPVVEASPARSIGGADVHEGDALPVLFFDLGDRDLTADEARAAIDAVLAARSELGIPDDRPIRDVVAASYANVDEGRCFPYDHPDHVLVADLVLDGLLDVPGEHVAPVCRHARPGAERRPLEDDVFRSAFAVDGDRRVGAHTVEYGWLLEPYWVGDPDGQDELFHREQWYVDADR